MHSSIKTILLPLIAISAIFIFLGCPQKAEEQKIIAPQGMSSLNLSEYGKPFIIFVPDTSHGRLSVDELTNGTLEIKVGDNFAIGISEQQTDLQLLKEDLKQDDINKLQELVKDDAATLIWKSQIVNPEFHFTSNQLINDRPYSFEDIRNTQARPFTKDEIDRMFESAKTTVTVNKKTNT